MGFPGIIISALRGGSGKTIFSVGVIAALTQRGKTIAPFKKGPDYIDAGWLALAAGQQCYNLDTFLIPKETILKSFTCYTQTSDLAVIEGNRGLYDSIDRDGNTSTAELAKHLDLPVILCIDGTKTTRTMAAVVLGCQQFDPGVRIRGVILNRVAGKRHENNLRTCIEHYCQIPVLGAVPKLKQQVFPERHMGLVPTPEHAWAKKSISTIADVISKHLDLDGILEIAMSAGNVASKPPVDRERECIDVAGRKTSPNKPSVDVCVENYVVTGDAPKIGIIRDSSFQFYYPENLEALEAAGAELVFTSPLAEALVPPVDALYIGGGFPETHAKQLADNITYRNQIRDMADKGLPIYAECGGLMYLGERLLLGDDYYAMTGIFPLVFDLHKRPQGHGYTIISIDHENPYFGVGTEIKGHEFHYSKAIEYRGSMDLLAFQVKRGAGLINGRDGICHKKVLATYMHIHSLGTPLWARSMVENAVSFQKTQP
ncbi:MAG: cobyrinate a,c-diamide synthase [Desulfobacterales bacterium]|nr:cobyrinate a,c-diamide synthase [Desulfobacterales bacterium]MDX2512450.1 cobyrinate a,c-diamide synthase [Desulfobacterales bacterium]